VANRDFGAETTAAEVVSGIDLSGKSAVVTGASGGLGAETARALASRGAQVTLTARDGPKAKKVAEEIVASTGNEAVDVMELHLDRPASVREFARAFRAARDSLDLLINNAGIMACPLERTDEGWELQFATNHLGHFLLTGLLAPLLRPGGRVVSVSSRGHRFSPVVFDDIHFRKRPYDKWEAYGQSKTANVLFAVELDRRLRERGVRAFGLHPGAIMTELGRHLSPEDIEELQSRAPSGNFVWKPVPAGAATSVWAATAPELEGQGGVYLEDCHVARPRRSDDDDEGYQAWAVDPEAAAHLWRVSEETLGESLDLEGSR
jgi:NAD(P)-dependent dehydrogenase (short-subunit alcohol dehydrogenase family)